MEIVVVGTGYVGLVTGTCLAELGLSVTCVDIDQKKIDGLKNGIIPIYEPGLEPMVVRNFERGKLSFTTSLADAMKNANVFFIAVGTPSNPDGSANLSYVLDVAREIGRNMSDYSVIVDKSTVPVGTADLVRDAINTELASRNVSIDFDVVSNPEFLKEGAAIDDFMHPDRIIVGADSDQAANIMQQVYAPFSKDEGTLLMMGVQEAEMSKYAANAMLATKISFINEIARLCDLMGVDVEEVKRGIGSDSRIGFSFINPGAGYGGSCFPKDVKALVHMAEDYGLEPKVLNAVEARNDEQKQVLFEKIRERFSDHLPGRTIAVWGLAFKPETDDMREASSLELIRSLVDAGARIKAYDPIAHETIRDYLPESWFEDGSIELVENSYDALHEADALALVTEWSHFREPDFDKMQRLMSRPIIFDGRNVFDRAHVKNAGFEYSGIGRGCRNCDETVEPLSAQADVFTTSAQTHG